MACACAALYFFNLRGDVLIQRTYRDDSEKNLAEIFRTQILNSKEDTQGGPIRTLGSVSFLYLRHNDIYMLCVTRTNANAMMAFSFMTSLIALFKGYFGGTLNEGSIKNNFVLIYELLDEVIDFGYPQITDPNIMKSFILQKGVKSILPKEKEPNKATTLTVTGALAWRQEGIVHKKNEVFLDVIEQVNMLVSNKGTTLRSDVNGKIMMKCLLSGMPEMKLGLSEKMGDMTFHQCVNLGAFDTQKVVTFIPPEGEFEVMKYRCQDGINIPFKVLPAINEHGRTRVESSISVKSLFPASLFALNVVVLVPVPKNTSKCNIVVSSGKAKYDASKAAIVWKIRRFPGGVENMLRADVNLVTTLHEKKPWARPPISMQFVVPMFSASGMRVQYLKIVERKMGSMYKVDKWVRKICKSGDFIIRW
eukprot:g5374.t1